MRLRRLVMIGVVACHKDSAPAQRQPPRVAAPIADAQLADTAPALVELLHAAPSTVRVSSTVANAAIQPAHLVDRDPSTAWNSRTGDLAGAWIDVDVGSAQIHELRLTAGFTAKGPKGDDYFTMNPRIHRISVSSDGVVVATATLDIARRDLQVIALPTPASHVRLRIDAVTPGTKPSWRETAVSELEAWGVLAPGTIAHPTQPTVAVGELPPDPRSESDAIRDIDDYCRRALGDLPARYRDYERESAKRSAECVAGNRAMCEMGGDTTQAEPPRCELQSFRAISPLPAPWREVGVFYLTHDDFLGGMCRLAIRTASGWWLVGEAQDCGRFGNEEHAREIEISGSDRAGDKLVLYYTYPNVFSQGRMIRCSADTDPSCDPPIDDPEAAPGHP